MTSFNIAALLRATGLIQPNGAPASASKGLQPVPLALPARIDGATPGCYALAMSDTDYHLHTPGISSTGLKKMIRSPAHYQAWMASRDDDDTDARRFGRAVHCLLLEPQEFDSRYVIWRGGDRRGNDYKSFAAAHATRDVLKVDEHERVVACAEAMLASPDFPLREYLYGAKGDNGEWVVKPARTEFTIIWVDEATGETCKVRLDAIGEQPLICLDLKTCGDARWSSFRRDVANNNYDLQAAFYLEGVRRFFGRPGTFIFGAVEATGGHGVMYYGLGADHDLILNGQRKYRYALDLYARCKGNGNWPGYATGGIVDPQMEPWMEFNAR